MARRIAGSETGLSLIEIIVSVALVGIAATGLLAALATGLRVNVVIDDQTVSASLVTSQLEDTLSRTYVEPAEYPTITEPEGFTLAFDNLVLQPTLLERITVTVSDAVKELFSITTHKVNTTFAAGPPTLLLAQRDFRWYENVDSATPTTSLAVENTPHTITAFSQIVRLRMSLEVDDDALGAGSQAFKLQYSTSQSGPWADVGTATSTTSTWRGFDNPAVADGATLPSLLLTESDVLQSYEEANPSVVNPNPVAVTEWAEWDWVVQENGAAFNTEYFFRMVKDDGSAFESYTRYPPLVMPSPRTFEQFDYRWFQNADSLTPGSDLAAEHASFSATTHGLAYRLRMNVEVDGVQLGIGDQAFKLQYSTSTTSGWKDVGAVGSTSTWRGFDNPSVADGASSTSAVLSTSDVFESYEEANPSVANPRVIVVEERGEWDWVVQDFSATSSATFYFRMVLSDGTPLSSYTFHPTIIIPAAQALDQKDYRWYGNNDSLTPTSTLAAVNTALSSADQDEVLRLRMNVEATVAGQEAGSKSFKLQYATSTGGVWKDVGAVSSTEIWRGFDNPTPADGATLSGLLLPTSTVAQTYEEQNPSASNPNSIGSGDLAEWDWVVQNNGATPQTAYYFRMVFEDGTAFDVYTRHPQLTTAAGGIVQQDYRWYANRNNSEPLTPLASENTGASAIVPLTVIRLRMNVGATGATLDAGSLTLKLQFATSTGGPWSDVGGLSSSEVWRGSDNSLVNDGAAITTLLLSASDVSQTYEETNPALANPNAIATGQQAEWDWVVQNNSSPADTYFFRVVKSSGDALDTYSNYPQVATVFSTLTQRDYQWYPNSTTLNPATSTALAAVNVSTTGATPGSLFRVRMNVESSGTDLPASAQAFRLQFTTNTSTGPWSDVGGLASTTIWRGFDNAGLTDGDTVSTILPDSDVGESYEESNPSVLNPNALSAASTERGEWDWVVEDRLAPTGTYFLRMVKSDGSALDSYTKYPTIVASGPKLTQEDFRWYANVDTQTPTTALAAINTSFSTSTHNPAYRLRMNVEVADSPLLAASQAFKFQYATTSTGPWTDVGDIGSSATWRGFDNASVADGSTLASLLLTTSTVAGTYEEDNPSASNPNAVSIGSRAEWDWVVQPNGTAASTTYYFRMVRSDDSSLETYTRYPALTTPADLVLTQLDYRWYANVATTTPTTSLAAENAPYGDTVPLDVVRLRMNVGVAGANMGTEGRSFKLQFASTTTGPWTDLGGSGSSVVWRGFDNGGVADGGTLPTVLLSTSTVAQSYEEFNPSTPNPNLTVSGARAEWDWVLEDNSVPSGTYFFRMVDEESGTTLDTYVNYPQISAAFPAFDQEDYRWYANVDGLTPVTALAATNTAFVATDQGPTYRLRLNVEVGTVDFATTTQRFKLQFATSTGGPWMEVGGVASSTIWRGVDNASVADGATITTLLLASSDVAESYEETNPSALNPNRLAASIAQRGEWDWVLQPNGAAASTSYYFRMVTEAGAAFDTYTNYPRLVSPPNIVFDQQDYRWYDTNNSLTPTTALAAENTPHTGVNPLDVVRLRMNVDVTGANIAAGAESFKLQYATSTSGPWTDVGGLGSLETWRGFDNAGATADGATLPSTLVSTSDVAESYEEENPTVDNPNAVAIGQNAEWDWVLESNTAPSGTYFFRMARADGTAFDTYTNYPELSTTAPTYNQDEYQWYVNIDNIKPSFALAAENTPYTESFPPPAIRLRVNVQALGTTLPKNGQAFKLQFSNTTTGAWTDIGDIGSLVVWRGYDNPSVSDGATLNNDFLTNTDQRESYEEANPSVTNPRALSAGERGEWDWVVQNNGAAPETRYYFRVVKTNGTALDTYTRYPQVSTTKPVVALDDFESGGFSGGEGWLAAWTATGDASVRTTGSPKQGAYHLSPNPPKDTDGRREGSGRGWVRELQGRWPGVLG